MSKRTGLTCNSCNTQLYQPFWETWLVLPIIVISVTFFRDNVWEVMGSSLALSLFVYYISASTTPLKTKDAFKS